MAESLGRSDDEPSIAQELFLALPAAALLAFRHAQGDGASGTVSAQDHEDALNIAASALSRLLAIYAADPAGEARVPFKLDVRQGRFTGGATEFRRHDGAVITAMAVKRADLDSALSLIGRAGIPFGLAAKK